MTAPSVGHRGENDNYATGETKIKAVRGRANLECKHSGASWEAQTADSCDNRTYWGSARCAEKLYGDVDRSRII